MEILITGALGHIGSKFIHSFIPGTFDTVHMIDNLSTQKYSSLFNLPKDIKFSFIEDDICTSDLNCYFQNIDVVVHLAAITDAESSFQKKDEIEKVNFEGTKRVAEACIKNNVKLIFPSTTSVYGNQEEVMDESCSISDLKPQSPYAESKLKAEQLLSDLGKSKGLKFVICRFGTIFGPSVGMRFHTAVNKFCWQAVMGQHLTVWKTALYQKRPYLGVNDAVSSINFIINKNLFNGEIYNVVSSNNSVNEIVNHIQKIIPDLKVDLVESRIMNQLSYVVSNDRFKNLGFQGKDVLEQGIFETIHLLGNACNSG